MSTTVRDVCEPAVQPTSPLQNVVDVQTPTHYFAVDGEALAVSTTDGTVVDMREPAVQSTPLLQNFVDGQTPPLSTAGQKRARKKHDRLQRDQQQHPLLAACCTSCKRKCVSKGVDRSVVHDKFWEMGYNERKSWIAAHVKLTHVKRHRSKSDSSARNYTRIYTLPAQHFVEAVVCKKFFLTTLGLTCDKVITTAVSAPCNVSVTADRRGKHEPGNKFSDDICSQIKTHIESYHPSISHYRREHAPFRRYISPEISVTDMHKDYVSKYPQNPCSYESYRKVLKSMNISFAKLGEEECELCMQHSIHKDGCDAVDCELCRSHDLHMKSVHITRRHYKEDLERDDDEEVVLSCDMQKIIMLPRMPGVKTCVFTRRLVTFHETFAPLGGNKKSSQARPLGVVWHEGISGRNADDIMSCFSKAMHHPSYRDVSKFCFYADNCGPQNKNWTLYTGMVAEVNRPGGPEQITIKYLEKGHTFMAADSFHARVESELRKMQNVYDFEDFKTAINQHGIAVPMDIQDFSLWENGVSSAKFTRKPVLADLYVVQFRKGCTEMYWKTDMDSHQWEEGDFLKKKTASRLLRGVGFTPRSTPRGIPQNKKREIETKLCSLMPECRRVFWNDLSVNDNSDDLIDCQ